MRFPNYNIRRSILRFLPLSFAVVLFGAIPDLSAAPHLGSIANAATNIASGQPLAPGEIIVLTGTGLGPDKISFASQPFQATTLSGTSVTVTSGDITVDAPMYYTSSTQIAALLPSNIPNGTATFTVAYNGETSNSAGHGVARGTLGIFTIDSTGEGPGLVTYAADYSLVSALKAADCGGPGTKCGAANPGDVLILWGTGLGAVTGNELAGDGLGQDRPDIALTLWLGGIQAPILFKGRSGCCVGLDQIAFTVPDDVPTGCAVPLIAQFGTSAAISNAVTLPVAIGSRNCTPTNAALATVAPTDLLRATTVTLGDIDLNRTFAPNGNGGYLDQASFRFHRFAIKPGMQPFYFSYVDDPPPGTCLVRMLPYRYHPVINNDTSVDGGASLTVTGLNGSVGIPANNGTLATIDPAGKFLDPGLFTVTGIGGTDVGPFTATLSTPAAVRLTSPAPGSGTVTVTRANGLTAAWSGGDSNGVALLTVTIPNFLRGSVQCWAPASAHSFTIPPYVLLPLPANASGTFNLWLGQSNAAFTAPGLGLGILHSESVTDGLPAVLQ